MAARGLLWSCIALLVATCTLSHVQADEDVAVCGGFVKLAPPLLGSLSNEDMDFSSVRVKLVSSSGFLKHDTMCAQNGYFFVPLYDSDTYTIQVETKDGWSFETTSQKLEPDAAGTFQCEDDIDFRVSGFRVSGHVDGAQGVKVVLHSARADRADVDAVADASGAFTFDNIAPGTYTAVAHHPTWTMDTTPQEISVGGGAAAFAKSFTVRGYDVRGSVVNSLGNPQPDAAVFLYAASTVSTDPACTPVPSTVVAPTSSDMKPACFATTGDDGTFLMSGVPAGDHTFRVAIPAANAPVTIAPAVQAASVAGSTELSPFTIESFSLLGRVVRFDGDAQGVSGATVSLTTSTGTTTTTSASDGSYSFANLTPGIVSLAATLPGTSFADVANFHADMTSASFPDIVATAFDVCGAVFLSHVPASLNIGRALPRTVELVPASGGTTQTATTDSDGNFCFRVAAGTYTLRPPVSSKERVAGLVLTPSSQSVTVDAAVGSVLGLEFSPSQVSVSGRVSCLEGACDDGMTVVMKSLEAGAGSPRTAKWLPSSKPGVMNFKFSSVWPGRYEVVVNHESGSLCWDMEDGVPVESKEARSQVITVADEDIVDVSFAQTGFVMTINSDHELDVRASHDSATVDLHVVAGTTHQCVAHPGKYIISAGDCFKLAKKSYTFRTAKRSPVELQVAKYRVSGLVSTPTIATDATTSDIKVSMRVEGPGDKSKTKTVKLTAVENGYRYKTTVNPGATVTVTPTNKGKGDAFMFYPASFRTAIASGRCPDTLPTIVGQVGKYLQGDVSPALAGVTVSVHVVPGSGVLPDGSEPVLSTVSAVTDSAGHYRVGPVHHDVAYKLEASKPGYFFEATASEGIVASNGKGVDFVHRRLGQVTISARDEDGEPITGVVLSLSRERYRHNNSTGPDGSFTFVSLFPGAYLVRPVLKEYTFEPLAITVDVEEGGAHAEQFTAKRVAFSCFGVVQSLNGAPEAGVLVSAVATDAPMEETATDALGKFRLRGLKPGVSYEVSVRDRRAAGLANVRSRSSPKVETVVMGTQDRVGVDFVMFRDSTLYTVTGTVNTEDRWLEDMTVVLTDSVGKRVGSRKLSASRFFEFPGLQAGAYTVTAASGAMTEHWEDVSTPVALECSGTQQRVHVAAAFKAQPRSRTKELLPLFSKQPVASEDDGWGDTTLPNSRTGGPRKRKSKKPRSKARSSASKKP